MARARDLLGRFLQPPTPRERVPPPDLPARIGPVELSPFGAKWMAVRCPSDLDPLMRKVGGLWEAGSRRWLIERRRLGPLVRELRRSTDPLFRRAGMSLDDEG